MNRREDQHNTREQVVDYLSTAAAIVAELELDDDLKVPAFLKACDLIASKQITFEQLAPGTIGLLGQPRG